MHERKNDFLHLFKISLNCDKKIRKSTKPCVLTAYFSTKIKQGPYWITNETNNQTNKQTNKHTMPLTTYFFLKSWKYSLAKHAKCRSLNFSKINLCETRLREICDRNKYSRYNSEYRRERLGGTRLVWDKHLQSSESRYNYPRGISHAMKLTKFFLSHEPAHSYYSSHTFLSPPLLPLLYVLDQPF